MRALSEKFIYDLSNPEGLLYPILTRVKKDQTLMLAIREGYINIYYRGGNILKIKELGQNLYRASFDKQYNKFEKDNPVSPDNIKNQDDAKIWVATFPERKKIMDLYFSVYGKAEREFQQLVARENNYSSVSNESEYFISDIEVADPISHARFDILAIRWLASQRKKGNNCRAALIEMKYGDKALGGVAGLVKHLKDMDTLISNQNRYASMLQTMELQFNQLDKLGLLKFNRGTSNASVKLDTNDKPEVIFLLANHNPRSTKLSTILDDPEVISYGKDENFDLRFFVSRFAGYGLHTDCMLTLSQFRKLLEGINY